MLNSMKIKIFWILLLILILMGCSIIPSGRTQETVIGEPTESLAVTQTIETVIEASPSIMPPIIPTVEPTQAYEQITLFIAHYKVECVGVAPQECFLIKGSPEGEWENFYDQIQGFDWEAGYEYELLVKVFDVINPPADSSSLRYELVEVISKQQFTVQSIDYIRILSPLERETVSTTNGLLISGMGAGLFEGNVALRISDLDGHILREGAAIVAAEDMGGEGPWSVRLKFQVNQEVDVEIFAFSNSPKDGSLMASDLVSVTLIP